MERLGRVAAVISVGLFLLFRSSIAGAYVISIVGDSWVSGENLSLSTTSNRISLSDFFDQYDETRWEIASVAEDADGRVRVTYDYPVYGTWDSYGAFVDVEFQILSESGDLSPEPVAVDVWGSSFYQFQLFNACCFSDQPQVSLWGTPGGSSYSAQGSFNTFAESLLLFSNTTYSLRYSNVQYVEGTPSNSALPYSFDSWEQYDSFVASRGMSGTTYASAFGFMSYNLALRPASVPEPGTFALLGLGLVGLCFARRRQQRT